VRAYVHGAHRRVKIHPTALVDHEAALDSSVEVGPYTVIGPDVTIGAGTLIGAHTVIKGPTRIGRDNRILQFVSLGEAPQDKKYAGEPTRLEIGDRNLIREFCTFNRGTVQDAGVTRMGDDNWIMAYVHIAHDCQVDSNTIFANSASLAGHVHVGPQHHRRGHHLAARLAALRHGQRQHCQALWHQRRRPEAAGLHGGEDRGNQARLQDAL
jgi:acyl-ACP--UDP-N-acetylglucosamine O-acyltransferase